MTCASLCTRWDCSRRTVGKARRTSACANLVDSINASVEALERLLSALLDISKLDTGAVMPNRARFRWRRCLTRIEQRIPAARRRQARCVWPSFRRACGSTAIPCCWNGSSPIFASNAVRHTEHGGVVIGVRRRGERIAHRSAGYQASASRRPSANGYSRVLPGSGTSSATAPEAWGSGLAIVRRLATLLEHPLAARFDGRDADRASSSRFRARRSRRSLADRLFQRRHPMARGCSRACRSR